VAAFANSNCFLVVPEDADRLSAGDVVRILLLLPENPRVQSEPQLSHYDDSGKAGMVDVSAKQSTRRAATATAFVELSAAVLAALPANPKGNPLEVARFAGIQAAKRTSELIPMCHPLALTHVDVQAEIAEGGVHITSTVATVGPTGVEMEALTAASVAALTVYDMTKALDKGIVIREVRLEAKTGGKSGDYVRNDQKRSADESKPE
jgi:cyclic pyranopterin phosphate synthase